MRRAPDILPITILVVATVLVYLPILGNGFVAWDDNENFVDNPHRNSPALGSLAHYWSAPKSGLYVPATWTAWTAIAIVSSDGNVALSAMPFHAASLIVHSLSAVLLYLILLELTSNCLAATLGALVFALHPVQVESVAWASGLKDVLAGCFSLGAVWVYLKVTRRTITVRSLMALPLFALALLCKPSVVSVPLAVVVVDVLVRGRSWKFSALAMLPWLVLAGCAAVIARNAQDVGTMPVPSLWQRPIVALDALTHYLTKVFIPLKLGLDYGRNPATVLSAGIVLWWVLPAAVALIALRSRAAMACLASFVLLLLPTLGFTPFQFQFYSTVADHYLYLPMAAVGAGVAIAVMRWNQVAATPAICALLALGVLSYRQTLTWRTSTTLFEHALRVNPDSALASNNLATALAGEGKLAEAIPHYLRAVRAIPYDPDAHRNLARSYANTGRLDLAVEHLSQSIQLRRTAGVDPGRDPLLLARLMIADHRAAEAVSLLQQIVQSDPHDTEARQLLQQATGRPQ